MKGLKEEIDALHQQQDPLLQEVEEIKKSFIATKDIKDKCNESQKDMNSLYEVYYDPLCSPVWIQSLSVVEKAG